MLKRRKFRKTAWIEDQATGKVVEQITFPKLGGGIGRIVLAPSIVNDRRNLERHLRDAGARLPRARKRAAVLLERLGNELPATQYVYAAGCGWRDKGRAFVLPHGLIGSATEPVIGINPHAFKNDTIGSRGEAGTWREWRDKVAKPAGQSSLLMCAISFALAAPLLSLLNRDSRTICLFGPSRSGKTTATLVAASVIGIGRTVQLPNWNVTDARLEQQIALFNDSLFPIDDLGIIGGKVRDAYQRIHDLAYRLHQGWGRGRHSSFATSNALVREQWRSIGMTSSEVAIRDLAHAAGCQRQAGECVRLIDVPVLIAGKDNLFDRTGKTLERRASADILGRIVEGVSRHHGRVFRRHALNIIKERAELKKYCNEKIRHFSASVKAKGDGNLARDVAETFGLAFAAGCFAIRRSLLPWRESDLLGALTTIYSGAREMLPDPGVALRNGLGALRGVLRGIQRSAVQGVHNVNFETASGTCRTRRTYRRFFIKGDAYNSIFPTAHEKALVTAWLLRKGRMTAAGPSKAGQPANLKPKHQIVWPDGKRRRSVEILWPRKRKRRQG